MNMNRQSNRHLEAMRDLAAQIVGEVAAPNAPPPSSGFSGSGPGDGEAEPASFEADDGSTIYQFFTEMDSTESGAAFM